MSRFVVDTHALIWFVLGDSRLGAQAKAELANHTNSFVLPAIAWAEALWILALGRTTLSPGQLQSVVDRDPRFEVYPLTKQIVELADSLTSIPEMHDRQIAATALHLAAGVPLPVLTKDAAIAGSGLVATVW